MKPFFDLNILQSVLVVGKIMGIIPMSFNNDAVRVKYYHAKGQDSASCIKLDILQENMRHDKAQAILDKINIRPFQGRRAANSFLGYK